MKDGSPDGMHLLQPPLNYEIVDDMGVFRPNGSVDVSGMTRLVSSAIEYTREHGLPKLLVDLLGLSGYDAPSITERYYFAREWANASGGRVHIAIVSPADHIDAQKFGVTVASNFGASGDIFPTELEARAWLQARS